MPQIFVVLIVVAAVVTAPGFIRPVWFVSGGYGYCIAAMAVITAILGFANLTAASVAQLSVLALWGIRLSTFILLRQGTRSYQHRPDAIDSSGVNFALRFLSWLGVTVLYTAMFSPAAYVPTGEPEPAGGGAAVRWIGIAIMVAGLAIESLADAQKQAAKRRDAAAFVHTGLFSWVRAPNYFGEILLWVGNLLAGAALLTNGWRIGVAVTGTLLLVTIMLGATRRLEWTQGRRYGDQADYQRYITTVPVLIPWVPIYSVEWTKIPRI